MDPVGLRGPATHTSHDCHLSPEVGHHWKLLLLDRSHADVVTFSPEGGSSNPAAGSRTLPETSEVVPYSAETATYSPGIGTQSPEVGTYSPEAAAAGSCHSLAGSCRLLLRCSLLAGSRRLSLFRRRLPLTLRSCHLLTGSRASPESPEIVTFSPSVVTYSPEVVHAPLSGGVFSERQTGLPYRDGCAEVSRLQREREREREIEIDNVCVCAGKPAHVEMDECVCVRVCALPAWAHSWDLASARVSFYISPCFHSPRQSHTSGFIPLHIHDVHVNGQRRPTTRCKKQPDMCP